MFPFAAMGAAMLGGTALSGMFGGAGLGGMGGPLSQSDPMSGLANLPPPGGGGASASGSSLKQISPFDGSLSSGLQSFLGGGIAQPLDDLMSLTGLGSGAGGGAGQNASAS